MAEGVQPRKARTVAIASGKGGVGKTVITANLSLSLAQQFGTRNRPVVAIDLDLGCENLNSCLGVRSPNGTINSFLSRKVPSLRHILTPTPQKHLHMICSSYSGSPEMALTERLKKNLLDEASALEASWVLMDLGAGTSGDVLDLFLGATEKIIVITPEALSLHNAFLFLKTLILHYLWRELGKEGLLSSVKPTWQKLIDDRQDISIPELIDRIRDWDRYAAYVLTGLIDDLKIKFLVNQYRGSSENSHLKNFHHLLFKYLCVRTNISYLGFVYFDEGVRKSVQAIKPFLLDSPENQAAQDLRAFGSASGRRSRDGYHPSFAPSRRKPSPFRPNTRRIRWPTDLSDGLEIRFNGRKTAQGPKSPIWLRIQLKKRSWMPPPLCVSMKKWGHFRPTSPRIR